MGKNKNWKRKAKKLIAICQNVDGNCDSCTQEGKDTLCTEIFEEDDYTPYLEGIRSIEKMCKNKKKNI